MKDNLFLKIKKNDLSRLLKMPKYNNKNIYFRNIILDLITSNQLNFLIVNLKMNKKSYYSFLTALDTFCFFIQNKFDLKEKDIEEYLINIFNDNNYDMQIFYNYQYFNRNYSGAKFSVIFNKIILNKFQIVLNSLYDSYLIKLYVPNFNNNSKLYNFKYFRHLQIDNQIQKSFINNKGNNLDEREIYVTLKNFLDLLKIQGLNNLYLIKTVTKTNQKLDLNYDEFWSNILKLVRVNKETFNYKIRYK